MYFYQIGWGSYEESSYRMYCHEKKFTKKQLEKRVCKAVKQVGYDLYESEVDDFIIYKSEESLRQGFDNPIYYKYKLVRSHMMMKLSDLIDSKLFSEQLEKQGFIYVQPHNTASAFGWVSAFDIRDWGEQKDVFDKQLINATLESIKENEPSPKKDRDLPKVQTS